MYIFQTRIFFCCPPIVCDSTDPGDAENTKEIFSGMFPKGAGPMCQTNLASVTKSLVVSHAAIPSSDIDMMTLADVLNSQCVVCLYISVALLTLPQHLYHHALHSNLSALMG